MEEAATQARAEAGRVPSALTLSLSGACQQDLAPLLVLVPPPKHQELVLLALTFNNSGNRSQQKAREFR